MSAFLRNTAVDSFHPCSILIISTISQQFKHVTASEREDRDISKCTSFNWQKHLLPRPRKHSFIPTLFLGNIQRDYGRVMLCRLISRCQVEWSQLFIDSWNWKPNCFVPSSRYPICISLLKLIQVCQLQSVASLVFCGDFDQNARRSIAARRYDGWQVWQMFLLELLGCTMISSTSLLDSLGISATWFLELSFKRYQVLLFPDLGVRTQTPTRPVENWEATHSCGPGEGLIAGEGSGKNS